MPGKRTPKHPVSEYVREGFLRMVVEDATAAGHADVARQIAAYFRQIMAEDGTKAAFDVLSKYTDRQLDIGEDAAGVSWVAVLRAMGEGEPLSNNAAPPPPAEQGDMFH